MDRTSRFWAQELEGGPFNPSVQFEDGGGNLCLWGEEHVVFQTSFKSDGTQSTLFVKNIRNRESNQIAINFQSDTIMVTMGGQLFVIGRDPVLDQVFMMSFASPEIAMEDTPNGQRIDLLKRPISRMQPFDAAYGVLENEEGVHTLIVAGPYQEGGMYCESYALNSEWANCASPPGNALFGSSIVWKNRLVALSDRTLYVYNHNTREGELLGCQQAVGDLCLDERHDKKHFVGKYEVWCQQILESNA